MLPETMEYRILAPGIRRRDDGLRPRRPRSRIRSGTGRTKHDRTPFVRRVKDHRRSDLQRREGKRQHTPKWSGIDWNGNTGQALSRELLRYQSPEGMSDDCGLDAESLDDFGNVICDATDTLAREEFGMAPAIPNCRRVIGPVGALSSTPRLRTSTATGPNCRRAAKVRE